MVPTYNDQNDKNLFNMNYAMLTQDDQSVRRTPAVPSPLVPAAGPVAHQEDDLLRAQVLIGRRTQRGHGALHERRGPAHLRAVLQVVLVQIGQ